MISSLAISFYGGIPLDFLVVLLGGIIIITYLISRYLVKGTPVKVIYTWKNRTSEMLTANEQISGSFIRLMKRNKTVFTVTKKGLPIEMRLGGMRRERWYFVNEGVNETIDIAAIKSKTIDDPSQIILHQEIGATQGLMDMISQNAQGSMRTLMMPLLTGFMSGTALMLIIMVFLR